jgi:magnesium transporter
MILYYPVFNKERRETRPRQLNIIITKDTLITTHHKIILPIKSLLDNCNLYSESKKNYMSEGTGQLLFYALSGFWKNCLTRMQRINQRIDEVEKEIFRGKEKEMVLEISFVKTDIIDFLRIIEPQEEILDSLYREGSSFFGPELKPYFSDILGTHNQVLNHLRTYKETILALEDTNQSLLSSKTNEIIQLLTVFSVIMLPLTFIASVWGMNIHLPLDDNAIGFWVIIGLMSILTGLMVFYFRKKKWL